MFATGVASGAGVAAGVMIKTTINAGVPFTIGPWEIVVFESTTSVATSFAGTLTATTMREPFAVVVRHPDGDRTVAWRTAPGRDTADEVALS